MGKLPIYDLFTDFLAHYLRQYSKFSQVDQSVYFTCKNGHFPSSAERDWRWGGLIDNYLSV